MKIIPSKPASQEYDWAADYRRHAAQLRERAAELLREAEEAENRSKQIEAEDRATCLPDLDRALRAYQPPGALVPPASFARDGVDPRILAKLLGDGPATLPDSLDAIVAWAVRHG